MTTYTAVDLGATSGRVVNVRFEGESIALEPVHRFPTTTRLADEGSLVWDFAMISSAVLDGLGAAARRGSVRSVGIDSWAVDYGLLARDGRRVGPVHAYRSKRTDGVMAQVVQRIGRQRIYDTTGIQFLPFNTIYQLVASERDGELSGAEQLLMVPDLLNHLLCGSTTNDVINASTTQLLDGRTLQWDDELCTLVGIPRALLPDLHRPGTELGHVHEGLLAGTTQRPAVVSVASHDTASAVAGTPLHPDRPAMFISCGTWALVGCELPAPVTDARALAANVTNELGVDSTTRLLKNVTGLWLLEECRRAWAAAGRPIDTASLLEAATAEPGGVSVIDPDHPVLGEGGSMPELIAAACRETGQPEPVTPAQFTRTILDSLALSFRRTVRTVEQVSGTAAEVIHLVGGGSQNRLLARLTASACERPVWCGPVEATVLGNAIVQAIAAGDVASVAEGRRLVERAFPPTIVQPESLLDWDALEARVTP